MSYYVSFFVDHLLVEVPYLSRSYPQVQLSEDSVKLDLTVEEARAIVNFEARVHEGRGLTMYERILKILDGGERGRMDR